MSLLPLYQEFLRHAKVEHLTANAALHYIPSGTTIGYSDPIVKHCSSQVDILKKKKEEFKNVVEDENSLCIEAETTIHFTNGGGAYLPAIDSSLIADRTVTIPIVHIVNFSNDKIQQIRLYWDMGSLLKTIEIIGRSGRNWPLRDGSEQLRVINSSTEAAANAPQIKNKTRRSRAGTSGTNDSAVDLPYRETNTSANRGTLTQSFKPAERDWNLGGEEAPQAFQNARSSSPAKRESENPQKAGGGLHHARNRIFDTDTNAAAFDRPLYKSDPNKYSTNIDLSGEAPIAKPLSAAQNNAARNNSSWSTDDFNTPPKKQGGKQSNDLRHFGIGSDSPEVAATPQGAANKARPDSNAHFQIEDRTPEASKAKQTSVDERHMWHTDAPTTSARFQPSKQPLSPTSANSVGGQHSNSSSRHFSVDRYSSENSIAAGSHNGSSKGTTNNGINQHKGLVSSWSLSDDSGRDEVQRGISIKGNGQGGRLGSEWWLQDQQ